MIRKSKTAFHRNVFPDRISEIAQVSATIRENVRHGEIVRKHCLSAAWTFCPGVVFSNLK